MNADRPLPKSDSASSVAVQLAAAYEALLETGATPSLSLFVSQVAPPFVETVLVELLKSELKFRIKNRTPVDKEAIYTQFPQHADVIKTVFERYDSVDSATIDLEGSRNGSSQLDTHHGSDSSLPDSALPPRPSDVKATFAHYSLLGEIARGGMGVVYRAYDTRLDRLVALKMILSGYLATEDAVKRFAAEAKAAASLNHPSIVPIYEIGQHDGQHYFTMPLLEGGSLQSRIDSQTFPAIEAAIIAKTVADAVAYAHTRQIVHRDLKPQNILLDAEHNPKITDFGIAKRLDVLEGLTATGDLIGTPAFMAPEQANGDRIDHRIDIYSLGAILYTMLTGRPPFQAEGMAEVLVQVVEQEPTSPRSLVSSVPRDLETICLKCLEKEPSARYDNAAELANDLALFLDGSPIKAHPISKSRKLWKWCRRHPMTAGFISSLSALFVIGIIAINAMNDVSNANAINRLESQLQSYLDQPELSEDWYQQSIQTAASLDSQSNTSTQVPRVLNRLSKTIEDRLKHPRISDSELSQIERSIKFLATKDPRAAKLLTDLYQERSEIWQVVNSAQPPFDNIQSIFVPDTSQSPSDIETWFEGEFVTNDTYVKRSPHPPDNPQSPYIELSPSVSDQSELTITYGVEWAKLKELAIKFRNKEGRNYAFVLKSVFISERVNPQQPQVIEPITFADAKSSGGVIQIDIMRDKDVILRQSLSELPDPEQPLHFRCRVDRGELTVQINNIVPVLFNDIFAISAVNDAVFSFLWPAEQTVEDIRLLVRSKHAGSTPLALGDQLFSQNSFEQAILQYRQQSVQSNEAAIRDECAFKEGLCLLRLERDTEAIKLWEGTTANSRGSKWAVMSAAQLLAFFLESKQFDKVDDAFKVLVSKTGLEQIANYLPEHDRQLILQHYQSQGSRYLSLSRLDDLRMLMRIQAILYPSTHDQRLERNVFRALWDDGRDEEAIEFAKNTLSSFNKNFPHVAHFVTAEYTQLLRARQQASTALAVLDDLLFETPGKYREANIPALLHERAATLYDLGRFDEAYQALVKHHTITQQVPYAHDSLYRSYGMLASLDLARGNTANAERLYQAIADLARRNHLFEVNEETTDLQRSILFAHCAMSQSNLLTPDESSAFLEALANALANWKVSSESSTGRKQVLSLLPKSIIQAAAKMWQSPQGRASGEDLVWGRIAPRNYPRLLLRLYCHEIFSEQAFNSRPTPVQSLAGLQTGDRLCDGLVSGKLPLSLMLNASLAWKGDIGAFGWKSLASALKDDPTLHCWVSYLMVHRLVVLNQVEQARVMCEEVESLMLSADIDEQSKIAMQQEIDVVQSMSAMLQVQSHPLIEVNMRLSDSEGNTTQDIKANTALSLTPGKYKLDLGATLLRVLQPDEIVLQENRVTQIHVSPLYRPSVASAATNGIVPRAWIHKGKPRWQVFPQFATSTCFYNKQATQFVYLDTANALHLHRLGGDEAHLIVPNESDERLASFLAPSPNGEFFLSHTSHRVQVRDVQTGTITKEIYSDAPITVARWGEDEQSLIIGAYSTGTIESRSLTDSPKQFQVKFDAWTALHDVALSPDKTKLASAHEQVTRIWDYTNSRVIAELPLRFSNLKWIRDNGLICGSYSSLKEDNLVGIVDPFDGKVLQNYAADGVGRAVSLELNSDETLLGATTDGGFLLVWDRMSGELRFKFQLSSYQSNLSWVNETELATTCENGEQIIWNLAASSPATQVLPTSQLHLNEMYVNQQQMVTVKFGSRCQSSIFDTDGSAMFNLPLSDVRWGETQTEFAGIDAQGQIQFYSSAGAHLRTLSLPNMQRVVHFDWQGNIIAMHTNDDVIHLWNTDGDVLREIRDYPSYISHISISPDHKKIAVASHFDSVRIYSVDDESALEIPSSRSCFIVCWRDPLTIAAASANGTYLLWKTGDSTVRAGKFNASIRCLAFSPDRNELAIAGNSHEIKIADMEAKPIKTIESETLVRSLAWVREDDLYYSSAYFIARLSTKSGELQRVYLVAPDVEPLLLSPAGEQLKGSWRDFESNVTFAREHTLSTFHSITLEEFRQDYSIPTDEITSNAD